MKYNKLFCILIVICVAITCLGVVSSAEITIGDEKFNLPDGFKEVPGDNTTENTSDTNIYIKFFENSKGDSIIIQVDAPKDGSKFILTKNPGDENKTINGIDGLYNKDIKVFTYEHNGKLITVSVTNENLLKDVLVKPLL